MTIQLREQIGYLIARCATLLRIELQDRFMQKGFLATGADWSILVLLLNEGKLTQSEIAAKTSKDRTTITRQIEQLEKRQLIIKEKDKTDLRVTQIELSEKGRDFVQQLLPIVLNFIGGLLEDVPQSDIDATKRCLNKILEKLSREQAL